MSTPEPLRLPPRPVQHMYKGGGRIAELHGIDPVTDHQPEEWLGSTVSRFGDPLAGLAVCESGELLRDVIAADPVGWLGPGRGRDASDTGILVKLLDPQQRLPVHVHPDRPFARRHLDCPYGKSEAWYILGADPGAAVYLGWNRPVDPDDLARARDEQDSEWMLARLNRIPVRPDMSVFVPAGTAHAIDPGIFLLEIQEPTDFSILLEWSITTATREESHLDLGFETAMSAVSTDVMPPGELSRLVRHRAGATGQPGTPISVLPEAADAFFQILAGNVDGTAARFPQGYMVLVVAAGEGTLAFDHGPMPVKRGDVVVVPRAAGEWVLEGGATLLACRPGKGWPATLVGG